MSWGATPQRPFMCGLITTVMLVYMMCQEPIQRDTTESSDFVASETIKYYDVPVTDNVTTIEYPTMWDRSVQAIWTTNEFHEDAPDVIWTEPDLATYAVDAVVVEAKEPELLDYLSSVMQLDEDENIVEFTDDVWTDSSSPTIESTNLLASVIEYPVYDDSLVALSGHFTDSWLDRPNYEEAQAVFVESDDSQDFRSAVVALIPDESTKKSESSWKKSTQSLESVSTIVKSVGQDIVVSSASHSAYAQYVDSAEDDEDYVVSTVFEEYQEASVSLISDGTEPAGNIWNESVADTADDESYAQDSMALAAYKKYVEPIQDDTSSLADALVAETDVVWDESEAVAIMIEYPDAPEQVWIEPTVTPPTQWIEADDTAVAEVISLPEDNAEWENNGESESQPPENTKSKVESEPVAAKPVIANHDPYAVPHLGTYSTGYWSEYGEGVMDIVVNNRIAMGQIPANIRDTYGDRFIAVYWYEDAFKEYTVTFSDGTSEVVYAVDWHNPEHEAIDKPFFLENQIIGELSYEMARRHQVENLGRGGTISR